MKTPKVSVLMLTCNRPHLISRAIESIIDQRFQDWELIVVHDGPEKKTVAVMKAWEARDSRIRYFHREQMGSIGQATNFALAQARGEYIAVIDDDDYWATTEKLRQQVAFLDENPDYVACGGGAIVVDPDNNELFRYLKPQENDQIKGRALVANPLVHSSLMYRAAAARQVGGYDETLAQFQDWDFGLRLGKAGKLYNFPEYLVYYAMWIGGSSFHNLKKNTRSAFRIVWRYRHSYSHLFPALSMAVMYHCYAHCPPFIRKNSFAFLSRLKKLAFAGRPEVAQVPRTVLE